MSTKIGHFEILSELAKSATGAVYKAIDPQSGQIVALKAIQLSAFGEAAAELEKSLVEEAETTNKLSSAHLTPVFGAGEIEGQFCAAMEYVQGNSVATMLARKEGFTIWDLLDIGRQVCNGLDHAHAGQVYHYSLEPAKIMCGWDGTVKILGFGVSSGGKFVAQLPGGIPPMLHYMSPEQILGAPIDGRSNLFSLGAMFYEMVTDRKAFDRDDAESLRHSILESSPVPPMHVNPKISPLLSDLIMKALEKDPAHRYQSGRELLDDLEKCKESKPQAAKTPPGTVANPPAVANQLRPAMPTARPVVTSPAQSRSGTAGAGAAAAPARAAVAASTSAVKPQASKPGQPVEARGKSSPDKVSAEKADKVIAAKSFAAAPAMSAPNETALESFAPDAQKSSRAPASIAAPKYAVDPSMAESAPSRAVSMSFSEIAELPPLKEIYVAPPPPPSASVVQEEPLAPTVFHGGEETEEKPKIQPREVAQKAITEIKNVPPRLLLYSVAGAAALILVIGLALLAHIHSLNGDEDSDAARPAPAAQSAAQTSVAKAAPVAPPAAPPAAAVPLPAAIPTPAPTPRAVPISAAVSLKGKNSKKKVAAPLPVPTVVAFGQMAVDSTPQGAQVQVDGRSDPAWVTPFSLGSLQPGQHVITVSKSGYSTDTRSVEVASSNKASVIVHLTQMMATLAVTSEPSGASIYVDGKDMGKATPAQVSLDKGQHVVLVRKAGYIDETSTAQFILGQTVSISPTLRPLGNVDSIKTVGKMKKIFGGGGSLPGQATVSIHTQPKGAQVAVNQHMLDKGSPVDVAVDPGNYVIDITLSGYAPVHKIISADKAGKVLIDEVLQRQ